MSHFTADKHKILIRNHGGLKLNVKKTGNRDLSSLSYFSRLLSQLHTFIWLWNRLSHVSPTGGLNTDIPQLCNQPISLKQLFTLSIDRFLPLRDPTGRRGPSLLFISNIPLQKQAKLLQLAGVSEAGALSYTSLYSKQKNSHHPPCSGSRYTTLKLHVLKLLFFFSNGFDFHFNLMPLGENCSQGEVMKAKCRTWFYLTHYTVQKKLGKIFIGHMWDFFYQI